MRIHIFGAAGAGVTTLGQALALRLGVGYFDTDDYFWLPTDPPYRQRRPPAARNRALAQDLADQARWVLGGSMVHWGADAQPCFDLVVFLYVPEAVRIARLRAREHLRYGALLATDHSRAEQSARFIRWAADYDHDTGIANRTLRAHQEWLENIPYPTLSIWGDTTLPDRVAQVETRIKSL